MIIRQELHKIVRMYATLAKEYSEKFQGEHEKKDKEILLRFSKEIGDKKPVWDFGSGPGHTARYLKNLGVEISGLDLSKKILDQARTNNPGIHIRKGNILELEFQNDSIAGLVSFCTIVHFCKEQLGDAFLEFFVY